MCEARSRTIDARALSGTKSVTMMLACGTDARTLACERLGCRERRHLHMYVK